MFGKCLPKSYQVRISLNEYNYNNIYRIIYTKLIYQSYVGQWWGVEWASISIFVTYNGRTKRATMPFMTILNEVCWRFSCVLFIWLIKRWLQQMKTKSLQMELKSHGLIRNMCTSTAQSSTFNHISESFNWVAQE